MDAIERKLSQLWYNPEIGFGSADRLHSLAKEKGIQVMLKQVRDFVKKQQVSQLHAPKKAETNNLKIVAPEINSRWQTDLIDLPRYASDNNGYRYILTIMDIYSRYAICEPLRNKDGNSVAEAFQKIFKEKKPTESLSSDAGKEFVNKGLQKVLRDNEIKQFTAEPGNHNRMGTIERFNRTLKTFLARYFSATGTNGWVNALPLFVKNYNNQEHRSIGMKPSQVTRASTEDSMEQDPESIRKFEEFKIGDHVRILNEQNVFTKGYEAKFSKAIYTIGGITGYSFELYDSRGNMLKRTYKSYQMQLISDVQKAPKLHKEVARLRQADIIIPNNSRTRSGKTNA